MITRFDRILAELDDLKAEFVAYIQNKDIPLEERWELWKSAPSQVKETECYIVSYFDKVLGTCLDLEREVCWHGDMYVDRYQTVKMVNVVAHMTETVASNMLEEDEDTFALGDERLMSLMEAILEHNLESFHNDW